MLLANGITRELPVFGFLGLFLIYGIIDQVEKRTITITPDILSTNGGGGSGSSDLDFSTDRFSNVEFVLSDTKTTRARGNIPKARDSNRVQLMIYRKLFDNLVSGNFTAEMLIERCGTTTDLDVALPPKFQLDLDASLSSPILAQINSILPPHLLNNSSSSSSISESSSSSTSAPWTLRSLIPIAFSLFQAFPRPSTTLELCYFVQQRRVHRHQPHQQSQPNDSNILPILQPQIQTGDSNICNNTYVAATVAPTANSNPRPPVPPPPPLSSNTSHQRPTHTFLGKDAFQYDEAWIEGRVGKGIEFWTAQRSPSGVEINDTFKVNIVLSSVLYSPSHSSSSTSPLPSLVQ